MSWINRLFVAVLLFPFVWAIVLLVEKRALRSTPPGERLLYPNPIFAPPALGANSTFPDRLEGAITVSASR